MIRLGGWQRVGIVASVLWAIGAGLVTRLHDVRDAYDLYNIAYPPKRKVPTASYSCL